MSDDLTAAGEALHVRRHPGYPCELLAGGSCQLQRDIRAIEQAAAARAVDEALSGLATLADPGSGGYVRIERGTTGWTLNCEGGDTGPWHEGDTIRDAIAAALVAHLRGPR